VALDPDDKRASHSFDRFDDAVGRVADDAQPRRNITERLVVHRIRLDLDCVELRRQPRARVERDGMRKVGAVAAERALTVFELAW
jgi:hypothetical protein